MDTRIASAIDHMQQHLGAPLSIATLAAAVHLSPSRFAHLFQREVGTSPARYLHALRMLRARVLLERTFLSVKEVMALVGCNDPSHFSRDFRSFHGVAPRACRLGAQRSAPTDEEREHSLDATAAVTEVAALANERRNPPRKPRPRARAPDATLQAKHRFGNELWTGLRTHSPHDTSTCDSRIAL